MNGTCFSTLSNSVIIKLEDIVENIKPFQKNGVISDAMSGEDISAVLQLETIPDLKRPDHNKFFYSIRSDKMKIITQKYYSKKGKLARPEWVNKLVIYLWSLRTSDWSISTVDLPEGSTIDDKLLLLWKF